jgi:hypothetical protein
MIYVSCAVLGFSGFDVGSLGNFTEETPGSQRRFDSEIFLNKLSANSEPLW